MDARKAITALLLLALPLFAGAQQTSDVKDLQQAKLKLIIGTDLSKFLSSITHIVDAASTHNQSPTAKAVYDYVQTAIGAGVSDGDKGDITVSGSGTVWNIDANAVGANEIAAGAVGSSELAQQGATTGQVLRWSGSAWVPNGLNLYDIVTTSQTVGAQYNQVWVNTISASITLNFPACNAANDGVKIEIAKAGSDNYGIVIEPAGSEEFWDGTTAKTLYSQGTSLSCTCRYTGGVGKWLFINM